MKTRAHKEERGFTLIETCIALVVLMIVACGVLPLGVYALKYNSAAAVRAGAIAAAQRKLEQLRAGSFNSCVSSSESVTISSVDSQTYTVAVTVTDVTTTLKNITITVTPTGRSTSGGVYAGNEGWMRGQVIVYTRRTTSSIGSNVG